MSAVVDDLDQMPFKELRRLVDEAIAYGVPDTATFSVRQLDRGALLLTWDEPSTGERTGLNLRRQCTCGHADCPDGDQ